MSRLFSIIVTLFILVLVYLWIGHITDRDQDGQSPVAAASREEATTGAAWETHGEDSDREEIDETAAPEPEAGKSAEPGDIPGDPEENSVREVTSKGEHLVIVGNFLERSNAEKHLSTVRDLGYPSTEILQFEISQYYTVCAGRYNSPAEARRVARKIKEQHGIDAYMRSVN